MNRLHAWKASQLPHLCLDLRSPVQYHKCHLVPSTNIPFSKLTQRQAELPPKHIPMAVLEPAEIPHASDWLLQRGWTCPFVFSEDTLDWQALIHQQLATQDKPRPWVLFQPSPFLQEQIEQIESGLQKQKPWRCLDLGSGAGRDIGWLVSTRPSWQATGFDSQPGAIQRMTQLVQSMGIQDRIQMAQVKFEHCGQWKWTSEPQPIHTYDLILNIRFMSRAFWQKVPHLLSPGGCFVLSQFYHEEWMIYKQPKLSQRLQLGEIERVFGDMHHMEIIVNEIKKTEDGRPLQCVIVRKIK
ncbi:uncharacterized protein B0P05DRAFT_523019 [Gilbertella persicaria]|uniref:uncharacterized protein n=1 Tax=Gilbertella persicaria TaxID=101096 RepID=UPI00221F495D|nr:uncharacterized protein B0P05DRAFT_523019 [Gilbertella persicaria]KAI8098022.1 hypothetical protein B0P05DRAFT_523019 [Gilbertella persicaria]